MGQVALSVDSIRGHALESLMMNWQLVFKCLSGSYELRLFRESFLADLSLELGLAEEEVKPLS